jgi:hypothetical protein
MSATPFLFRRLAPALALALLANGPAVAAPEPYAVSRAQAAATDCLRRQPAACDVELAQYLALATALLDDVREARTGQELRLRTTRSRLQREVAALREQAVVQLDPELQARADGLDRAIEAIDTLLGSRTYQKQQPTPPLAADHIRVVDLIETEANPPTLPPAVAALPPIPLSPPSPP